MPQLPRRDADAAHPLLAGKPGLREILDSAPIAIFLVDDTWHVVYRNGAAKDVLAETVAAIGDQTMDEVREDIFRRLRESRSLYPTHELIHVPTANGTVVMTITAARVTGGFVLHWRNVSADVHRTDVAAGMAQELARSGESLSVSGQALADATEVASGQAGALKSGAGQLTQSIREIAGEAAAAAGNSELAQATTRSAAEGMAKLQQSTSAIAAMAETIRGIAEQTNLLALNATIEAARAGRAGSGFAVVAGEVKELARRTAEATEQIRTLVEVINTQTGQAGESIGKAADLIQDVAARQTSIATAVEEQSAVAATMAASVETVANATASASASVRTTLATAESLASSAAELRNLVASGS